MNYKVLIPGVYEVTSFPFVYSIENLDSALASSTIVVPTDLPSLTTSGTEIITTGVCGDGLCDTSSESSSNCPEDCTSNRPWWVIIVLILVLAAGLFVIYYFKDKLFVQRSKPVSTKIFTNERDYQNIKRYVESSLRKGFTDMQIELALRKQGWKQNQISYILTEVKGSLKRK